MKLGQKYSRISVIVDPPKIKRDQSLTPDQVKQSWEDWAKESNRLNDVNEFIDSYGPMNYVPDQQPTPKNSLNPSVRTPRTLTTPLGVEKQAPLEHSQIEEMIRSYASRQPGMPTQGLVRNLPPNLRLAVLSGKVPIHEGPTAASSAMRMGRGVHFYRSPKNGDVWWIINR